MLAFIKAQDPGPGIEALGNKIVSSLKEGKKVLWLIAGGSNVPIAVAVMNAVRALLSPNDLSRLTITLTDERYGPVGHADSNWKQLTDTGFSFEGTNAIPVLTGDSLQETVKKWGKHVEKAMAGSEFTIAQFGMGADGHIAGISPHSPAVNDTSTAAGYESGSFTRVTLTIQALKKIDAAYAFVFGAPKREAVRRLQEEKLSFDEQPAQVLKSLKEAYFYTDCLE